MRFSIQFYTLFTFLTLLIATADSFTQVITWTGAGDGLNWSDANNWDTNTLPAAINNVLINNGNTVQINFSGAVGMSVAIGNGSTLNIIFGDLTIDNPI